MPDYFDASLEMFFNYIDKDVRHNIKKINHYDRKIVKLLNADEMSIKVTQYAVRLRKEIKLLQEKKPLTNKCFGYNTFVSFFPYYRKAQIRLKKEKVKFLSLLSDKLLKKKKFNIDSLPNSAVFEGNSFTLFAKSVPYLKNKRELEAVVQLHELGLGL